MSGDAAFVLGGLLLVSVISVIILALRKRGEVSAFIRTHLFHFRLRTKAEPHVPAQSSSKSPKKRIRAVQGAPSWMSRKWRAVSSLSFLLIILVASFFWWFVHPPLWRMLVCDKLGEALGMLRRDWREPWVMSTERETIDQLEHVMRVRIAELDDNPNRRDDIWVVDHYWRYWVNDSLRVYRHLNSDFVLKTGRGKIHRLFVLDKEDLTHPDLKGVLQDQCDIARNQTAKVYSDNFELRVAVREVIESSDRYKDVASQFERLPGVVATLGDSIKFTQFDVLQFADDALYFSNSFSHTIENNSPRKKNNSKEILDHSVWIVDPAQIGNVRLDQLFKTDPAAKKPASLEVRCGRRPEQIEPMLHELGSQISN